MKIGELSKLAEVPVETIRYYEQERLLMAPARSDGNYRVFGPAHVERLQFIRYCRSLDITLDEIRNLLKFQDAPNENCGEVDFLLDTQLAKVEHRIERLVALQQQLLSMRGLCNAKRAVKDCGIMHKLVCCDDPDSEEHQQEPSGDAFSRIKGKGSIALLCGMIGASLPSSAPYLAVLV